MWVHRSEHSIVAAGLSIKAWLAVMPSCAEVRPATCRACSAAAEPVGRGKVVVGRGVVRRTVLGPLEVTGPPEEHELGLRRYRCLACGHVRTVGPRGLTAHRLFSAAAIALGLVLYAAGATTRQLRERLRPRRLVGASAAEEWATAKRWLQDLGARGLLPGVSPVVEREPRCRAELAVLALSARAPDRSMPKEEQVFRAAS